MLFLASSVDRDPFCQAMRMRKPICVAQFPAHFVLIFSCKAKPGRGPDRDLLWLVPSSLSMVVRTRSLLRHPPTRTNRTDAPVRPEAKERSAEIFFSSFFCSRLFERRTAPSFAFCSLCRQLLSQSTFVRSSRSLRKEERSCSSLQCAFRQRCERPHVQSAT